MAVHIKAENIQENELTLTWQSDTSAMDYRVYRKEMDDDDFGPSIAQLDSNATEFTDDNIVSGIPYEYKIHKAVRYYIENDEGEIEEEDYDSFGYIVTGHNLQFNRITPDDSNRVELEKMLIIIDETLLPGISDTLQMFIDELNNDLINVRTIKVPRVEEFNPKAVLGIKNIILSQPFRPDYVLLLGRVAVPYSGNTTVDGHAPDHKGAWPADLYYGDIDDVLWTDSSVVFTEAEREIQHNNINDGKFDQSRVPGKVEIKVGRVDFYDLPLFQESEVRLINRYLNKNINYRNGKSIINERARIFDGFGFINRGYAASAWGNFSALFDEGKIEEGNIRSELQEDNYKWVYGNNSGGYTSILVGLYSVELSEKPYYAAFTTIFGSYNVDWDTRDNLLRSVVASEPMSVACIWSGRPFWTLHRMAVNESIGDAMLITQNNISTYQYHGSSGLNGMHISVMGDPSLKFHRGINFEYEYNSTNDSENPNTTFRLFLKDTNYIKGFNIYAFENKFTNIGEYLGFQSIEDLEVEEGTFPGLEEKFKITLSVQSGADFQYRITPVVEKETPGGTHLIEVQGEAINIIKD